LTKIDSLLNKKKMTKLNKVDENMNQNYI